MAEILDYYDPRALSTAFYDVVTHFDPTLVGEVDFYADLIPPQSWVLEVGCGTGRITLPLAERNYAVVGLDLSQALLARAVAKHGQAAPDLKARTAFVAGDMTYFELNHEFDAVIAPFFGFSHLPPGEARRRAMKSIAKHVRAGGLVAIHAVNPQTIGAQPAMDPNKALIDTAYDEAGRRLAIYLRSQAFDPESGRLEQILDYVMSAPDGTEARRSPERLTYFVSDLEADAAGTGLVLDRKISPFNTVGEMWVFRKG